MEYDYFQTIESILKPTLSGVTTPITDTLFPDYWVYFKAVRVDGDNRTPKRFPDYWVYFKAEPIFGLFP